MLLGRDALLARMGDVSVFMRELKQRFTIWYNHQKGNRGTLWMERFKSLVVELSLQAMATVAAYIDLNAVRAEQVEDPADYRYCSYAAAMNTGNVFPESRKARFASMKGADWGGLQVVRDLKVILFS